MCLLRAAGGFGEAHLIPLPLLLVLSHVLLPSPLLYLLLLLVIVTVLLLLSCLAAARVLTSKCPQVLLHVQRMQGLETDLMLPLFW